MGVAGLVVAIGVLTSERQPIPLGPRFVDRSARVAETDQRLGCREVLGQCDPYLLGKLPDEELGLIRSHLSHCPQCVVAYRQRAEELNREFSVLLAPSGDPAQTQQLLTQH